MRILILMLISMSALADWESHFVARTAMIALHAGNAGQGKVLLLGDSNTEGFWWATSNSGSCRIINGGMGGATVKDISTRAQYIASVTRPKIVHLMIGTNDVHSISPTFSSDLQAIYDAFNSYEAKVVTWPIPPFNSQFSENLSNRDALNTILNNVAVSNGSKWDWWWPQQIEGLDGYATPGAMNADGVHFSPTTQSSRYHRVDVWNTYLGGC